MKVTVSMDLNKTFKTLLDYCIIVVFICKTATEVKHISVGYCTMKCLM